MKFQIPYSYSRIYKCREVSDFIVKFFGVRKGNRCRIRHGVGRKHATYFGEKHRVNPSIKNLAPINKYNVIDELSQGASHFLIHIYDDDIIENGLTNINNWTDDEFRWRFKIYNESKYRGITYVVDIDSPKLHPEIRGNLERHDFFEPEVINYFNEVTKLVAEVLDDITKYELMFSGNGIYFILESFYPEEQEQYEQYEQEQDKQDIQDIQDEKSIFDSIQSYKDIIEDRLNIVDKKLEELNNPIRINAKSEGWNRYYKIPFVFHRNKPRISIPLNKMYIGNMNPKWLDYATNISNLIKYNPNTINHGIINTGLLKRIITECEWINVNGQRIW